MRRAKLRCQISVGQFNSECAVVVKSFNGKSYSLFAQKTDLAFSETPFDDTSVDGWIKVDVLKREDSLCLIRLPQTTLENGQFLTVRADQLAKAPDGVEELAS
jgi:hypothetical protein